MATASKQWMKWFTQIPAKIGTVPMTVWVDHDTAKAADAGTLETGKRIVFYEMENGSECTGLVIKCEPILFVDRF